MFDVLQALLWSTTYVLILISSAKGRKWGRPSIPYLALVLNFAWEVCALIHSKGLWIHVLWLTLDTGILAFGFYFLTDAKRKVIMLVKTVCMLMLVSWVFTKENGMLISVFVIDFIMAVAFLTQTKKLSPTLQLPIAITKLLGDLFAGLDNFAASPTVFVLALATLIINLIYFYCCLRQTLKLRNSKYNYTLHQERNVHEKTQYQ